MYTRDFAPEENRKNVPDSYCGNLFSEEKEISVHNEAECGDREPHASFLHSIFQKGFDIRSLSVFKKGFGTEEILIIGIAAFLLFSKGGDKECAIILLLSLFL